MRAGDVRAGRGKRLLDWFFRNRVTGTITIGQWPNAWLWLFLACAAATWLIDPSGTAGTVLRVVAAGALAAWALDEILRGVNPWRRCLGGGVLLYGLWHLAGRG